jgi:uncharacterized protein YjiS (DUF1127 family)
MILPRNYRTWRRNCRDLLRFRKIVSRLNRLSDRELAEFDICRGDIHSIARGSL